MDPHNSGSDSRSFFNPLNNERDDKYLKVFDVFFSSLRIFLRYFIFQFSLGYETTYKDKYYSSSNSKQYIESHDLLGGISVLFNKSKLLKLKNELENTKTC